MRPNSTCEHCGKPFYAVPAIVRRGYGRCCSRSCGAKNRTHPSLDNRFWKKVDTSGDCWLWTGKRTPRGYGQIRNDGKIVRTHRVSWELHYGPIPEGMNVLHLCDTPACVNPEHLFLGSHSDNMADMQTKQRASWGERSVLAKLTEDQVREMRQRYANGTPVPQLEAEYGVANGTVRAVVHRRTWRHLD